MRLRQLSDLIADARKASDMENATTFIPDADITEYLNQGWTRIYGELTTNGEKYYLTLNAFTTVVNQDTYYTTSASGVPAGSNILPTDIWRVTGVDMAIQGTRYINAQRFQFEQRNDYQPADWSWPMVPLYDYWNSGAQAGIKFIPPPTSAVPCKLWYYPAAIRMVNSGDTIDGGNGWELYAISYAAKECALKDENYELVPHLDAKMAGIMQSIKDEARSRNAGIAPKIRRVRYKHRTWMWPGGRL